MATIVEEAHVVGQWKHDFREDYQRLSELRSLARAPWGLFSATLDAKAIGALKTDLDVRDPILIKGLFTRPNIFLDIKLFDQASMRTDLLAPLKAELLDKKELATKTIVYTGKELASSLCVHVASAIGQYQAKTGGHKRVDYFMATSSNERKHDLRSDFMQADSHTRCLFATNALGMGLNILALYCVMDIDFVRTLADWCQQFGRAGRDGRPSCAVLCISSLRGKETCLKRFVAAFKNKQCMRMVIARYFDPTCSAIDIRNAQPGDSDAAKAHSCCRVCRERGTMVHTGSDIDVCQCGAAISSPFCPQCGAKRTTFS